MEEILIVQNIKCGGCAASIRGKLEKIDGITDVGVDVEKGEVSYTSLSEEVSVLAKEALKNMGYTQDDPSLIDSAMSYVSCMIGRLKKD